MNKKQLSERDICTKFITPALEQAGWDVASQIREEGKAELDNFTFPESKYPVIATTSKLMTTGVDAQTCKLIVLDPCIQSMTEFKQIIGRGTRINEDYDKYYFTILDFKKATGLFADPDFDGDAIQIYEPGPIDSPLPPDNSNKSDNPLHIYRVWVIKDVRYDRKRSLNQKVLSASNNPAWKIEPLGVEWKHL